MIIKNGYLKPSDTKISSIPFDELRNAIKHGTLYRNGRWEIVKEITD